MPFHSTPIADLVIFEPKVWHDERGYFFESYNAATFAREGGISAQFVQDNQARSTRGVLRGLHYQVGAAAQAKLVRVTEGSVFDVAVDLRPQSPTYGQWYGLELSAENRLQLFVPRGFAHGYLVLSERAEFFYKCDNIYSKADEGGLHYADPTLKINWQMDLSQAIVSEKDQILPHFGKHRAAL